MGFNTTLADKEQEINNLRLKVSRTITEKANLERKKRSQQREHQI